jgi:hypothetical protein
MTDFTVNVPVVQPDPVVKVEGAGGQRLPLGANRFSLVVVDDAGNESEPTFVTVIVRDMDKPTAVLDMVDENGKIVDPVVPFGSTFILSAARSSDTEPGKIVEYRFTLLDGRA